MANDKRIDQLLTDVVTKRKAYNGLSQNDKNAVTRLGVEKGVFNAQDMKSQNAKDIYRGVKYEQHLTKMSQEPPAVLEPKKVSVLDRIKSVLTPKSGGPVPQGLAVDSGKIQPETVQQPSGPVVTKSIVEKPAEVPNLRFQTLPQMAPIVSKPEAAPSVRFQTSPTLADALNKASANRAKGNQNSSDPVQYLVDNGLFNAPNSGKPSVIKPSNPAPQRTRPVYDERGNVNPQALMAQGDTIQGLSSRLQEETGVKVIIDPAKAVGLVKAGEVTPFTRHHSFELANRREMTPEEVGTYESTWATQGGLAAQEYYNKLLPELKKRETSGGLVGRNIIAGEQQFRQSMAGNRDLFLDTFSGPNADADIAAARNAEMAAYDAGMVNASELNAQGGKRDQIIGSVISNVVNMAPSIGVGIMAGAAIAATAPATATGAAVIGAASKLSKVRKILSTAGALTMGVQSVGSYQHEAERDAQALGKEATLGQRWTYGVVNGALEAASEQLALFKWMKFGDDGLRRLMTKNISKNMTTVIKGLAARMGSEGVQEALMEPANDIVGQMVGTKDIQITPEYAKELMGRMSDSFWVGALIGGGFSSIQIPGEIRDAVAVPSEINKAVALAKRIPDGYYAKEIAGAIERGENKLTYEQLSNFLEVIKTDSRAVAGGNTDFAEPKEITMADVESMEEVLSDIAAAAQEEGFTELETAANEAIGSLAVSLPEIQQRFYDKAEKAGAVEPIKEALASGMTATKIADTILPKNLQKDGLKVVNAVMAMITEEEVAQIRSVQAVSKDFGEISAEPGLETPMQAETEPVVSEPMHVAPELPQEEPQAFEQPTAPITEKIAPEASPAPQDHPDYVVVKTKHTKTGEPLWVVKPASEARLSDEDYKTLDRKLKRMGTAYSKLTGGWNFSQDPTEIAAARGVNLAAPVEVAEADNAKTWKRTVKAEQAPADQVVEPNKTIEEENFIPSHATGDVVAFDDHLFEITGTHGQNYTAVNVETGRETSIPFAMDEQLEKREKGNSKKPVTMDERITNEMGDRSIKAYSFENPEVRPFFVEKARELLSDLKQTQKAEKVFVRDEQRYIEGVEKISRATSHSFARIKDMHQGTEATVNGKPQVATYEEIEKALNALISDHGKENNALSKRIELVIDDMLVEGYVDIYGERIPANIRYIQTRNRIEKQQIHIPEPESKDAVGNEQLTLPVPGETASLFDVALEAAVDTPSVQDDNGDTESAKGGVEDVSETQRLGAGFKRRQDIIRRIQSAFEEGRGNAEALGRKHGEDVRRRILQDFQKETIFYSLKDFPDIDPDEVDFDAFVSGKTICVDVDSRQDIYFLAGHEELHAAMKNPGFKETVGVFIDALAQADGAYKTDLDMYISENYHEDAQMFLQNNRAFSAEELIADVIGKAYALKYNKDFTTPYVKLSAALEPIIVSSIEDAGGYDFSNTENTTPQDTPQGVFSDAEKPVEKAQPKANTHTVKSADEWESTSSKRQYENMKQIEAIMKDLGVEVKFFLDKSGRNINGYYNSGNVLHINRTLANPDNAEFGWFVTGHEFGHYLEQQSPGTYAKLLEFAGKNFSADAVKWYEKNHTQAWQFENMTAAEKRDAVIKEMLSDELGNAFHNTRFWEALNAADRTLFERVVAIVKKFFDSLKGKLAAENTYRLDNGLYDAKVIATIQREFSQVVVEARRSNRSVEFDHNAMTRYKLGSERIAHQPMTAEKARALNQEVNSAWDAMVKNHSKPKSAVLFDGSKDKTEILKAWDRAFSKGEHVQLEDLKHYVADALENADTYKSSLSKGNTIAELKKMVRLMHAYPPENKAGWVDRIYKDSLDIIRMRLASSNSIVTYGLTSWEKSAKESFDKIFADLTQEKLDAIMDARASEREAMIAKVKTPETLDDFRSAARIRALTPEEKRQYEDLIAESKKERITQIEERKATKVVPALGERFTELEESKNTKTGETLFNFKLTERAEKGVFGDVLSQVRKLGGSYWKGNFYFTTNSREEAQAKLDALKGGGSYAKSEEAVKAETEAKVDKTAEKLRALADGMQKTIDDKLAPRLVNTARRASMAAGIEADGLKLKKTQAMLRRIADALENGEFKFLDKLSSRAQVEQLSSLVHVAGYHWALDKSKAEGKRLDDIDRSKIPVEAIDQAKMPVVWVDHLVGIAQKLSDKPGFKRDAAVFIKRYQGNKETVPTGKVVDFMEKIKGTDEFKGSRVSENLADYRRLNALGIDSDVTLRAALREFLPIFNSDGMTEQDRKEKADRELRRKEAELARTKIEGYFPTPPAVVEKMLELANITAGDKVLEPSAGAGHIADAVLRSESGAKLDVVEWNGGLREVLQGKGHNVVGEDALQVEGQYDVIVMNPPFEKLQDVDHVRYAYENNLAPGGRLVAIMSESPFYNSAKKAEEFRAWLEEVDGWSEKLPDGAFKDSDRSTGVNTRIVTIEKSGERKPKTLFSTRSAEGEQVPSKRRADSWPKTVSKYREFMDEELRTIFDGGVIDHEVYTDKQAIIDATELIERNGELVVMEQIKDKSVQASKVLFTAAQLITNKYINMGTESGNIIALSLVTAVSEKARHKGQAIQALSMWAKLSPEGVLMHAKKVTGEGRSPKDKQKIDATVQDVVDAIERLNKKASGSIDIDVLIKKLAGMTEADKLIEKLEDDICNPKKVGDKKADGDAQDVEAGENEPDGELTPEELLARKVESTTKEIKESVVDPVRLMVDTLFKLTKESPLERPVRPQTATALQVVADAIKNREQYADVWEKAKVIVSEKLKDNPEAMGHVEAYLNHGLGERTFANTQLDKATKQELFEMGMKIRDIIGEHYTKAHAITSTLSEKMVRDAGLTGEEARILEKEIEASMARLTSIAKASELRRILAKRGKGQRVSVSDRIITLSNLGAFDSSYYQEAVAEKLGMISLTPELQQRLKEMSEEIQQMPEGRARNVMIARMMDEIVALVPMSHLRKMATLQTMAQLLNPKTWVRNFLGNEIFARLDRLAMTMAVPFDRLLSMASGFRTKVVQSQTGAAFKEGRAEGWKFGFEDAILGIDTLGVNKLDIQPGRTFRNVPVLDYLEKMMAVELRAFDRMYYGSSFKESLKEQVLLSENGEITPEMLERAHLFALYRTFQDDTKAAEALSKLKAGLNLGQEFGLGDFLLKYTKTPANLLMRGLDYTPGIGFAIALLKLHADQTVDPYLIQKTRAESLGRQSVGALLMALGYGLAALGVLSGSDDEDYDTREFLNQLGIGRYRINVSAVTRLVGVLPFALQDQSVAEAAAKLQKGDVLTTYDWALPSSLGVIIGADLQRKGKESGWNNVFNFAIGTAATASEALTEQSMLRGIQQFFSSRGESGSFDLGSAVNATLASALSSFVPSILGRVNTALDDTVKDTKGDGVWDTGFKKAAARIPGVAQMLPVKYTPLGKERRYYNAGINPLLKFVDQMLMPGFTKVYSPSEDEALVADLYAAFKDSSVIPKQKYSSSRKVPVTINKQSYSLELSPAEYQLLTRTVGKETQDRMLALVKAGIRKEDPEVQLKRVEALMTYMGEYSRKQALKIKEQDIKALTSK